MKQEKGQFVAGSKNRVAPWSLLVPLFTESSLLQPLITTVVLVFRPVPFHVLRLSFS